MYYLDLDKTDSFDKNQIPFKKFKFPAGELGLSIADKHEIYIRDDIIIKKRIQNSDDLILCCLANDAVRRTHNIVPSLFIPYFPYARQDRVCNSGESLSVKVIANIINSCEFKNVYVFDPHSDVTTALVNNINLMKSEYNLFINKSLNRIKLSIDDLTQQRILISPDAGAYKKVFNIAHNNSKINYDTYSVVSCEKVRDTTNGKIIGQRINGKVCNYHCIIIDDLIDGGATFTNLAQSLFEEGALSVNLIASHGIFSKGYDCFASMKNVIVSDSYKVLDSDTLTKYKFLHQFNISI